MQRHCGCVYLIVAVVGMEGESEESVKRGRVVGIGPMLRVCRKVFCGV